MNLVGRKSPPGTICRVKMSKRLVGGCHVFVVKGRGKCEGGYRCRLELYSTAASREW